MWVIVHSLTATHLFIFLVDLATVLTPEIMAPILANSEVQERLMPYLPSGESLPQTAEEIQNTLTSPQFQQVVTHYPKVLLSFPTCRDSHGPVLRFPPLIRLGSWSLEVGRRDMSSWSTTSSLLWSAKGRPERLFYFHFWIWTLPFSLFKTLSGNWQQSSSKFITACQRMDCEQSL